MQEQRQQMAAEPSEVVVDYAEYLVADTSEAAAVRAKVDTCNDLYGVAKGTASDRLSRKTVPQAQLPKDVAGALATLDAGESSVALTRGNWRVFLMLCRRGAPETEQPSRDEVRMQLTNQQLGARAEIYLEELRSEAIIKTP